ncbi:hypothetical protein JYU23_00450 [bacterium AH-315-C07]|nr:hypothetical protein [bacterium AH-315-C07]
MVKGLESKYRYLVLYSNRQSTVAVNHLITGLIKNRRKLKIKSFVPIMLLLVLMLGFIPDVNSQCIIFCNWKRGLPKFTNKKTTSRSGFKKCFTKKPINYRTHKLNQEKYHKFNLALFVIPGKIWKTNQSKVHYGNSIGLEIGYSIIDQIQIQIGVSTFRSKRISEPISYKEFKALHPDSLFAIYLNNTGQELEFITYQNNFLDITTDIKLVFVNREEKFKFYIVIGSAFGFVHSKQMLPKIDDSRLKGKISPHTSYLNTALGVSLSIIPRMSLGIEPVFRYSLNELIHNDSTISYTYLFGLKTKLYYLF